jgi:NAD(P)-dependent dehydrogenase (short-subunit alcohol dehydrogenase family)
MSSQSSPVALVMGGGSEWGRAVAVAFARRGYLVVANDISPDPLEQTAQAVRAAGGACRTCMFDAAKKMPVQALIGEVVEAYGRLDALVNAGFVLPAAGLLEMDEWDWLRTLDMNLGGPYFAIQVAGRVMREQGSGAIVNLLLDPEQLAALPGRAALAASQAALLALTRLAALELGAHHIRVNALVLKFTASAAAPPPGRLAHIPLKIEAQPQAIAEQVLSLCSAISGL